MSAGGPLVSVVMAVRDGASYLREAIDSALGQTGAELELLVVDDGSTDATPAILTDAAEDPRVTILPQEPLGVAAARNRALSVARGDLVAFLDSDDVWMPDKLRLQQEAFANNPRLAAAYTGYVVTTKTLRPYGVVREADFAGWLLLDGEGPALSSTAMVRASALGDELYFDEALSTAADLEFALRIAHCGEVTTLRRPLVRYRMHDDQMHGDLRRLSDDIERIYSRLYGDGAAGNRDARRGRANLSMRLMWRNALEGHMRTAAGDLRRVMQLAPSRGLMLPAHGVVRRAERRLRAVGRRTRSGEPVA